MIKHIVIVGGGSSGWMTAAYLSRHVQGIDITVIESSDIPIIGVGESTIPPMKDFMDAMGLSEKEWMPQCNATYKSAIRFRHFHDTNEPDFWYSFEPLKHVAGRPLSRYWYNKHLTQPEYADRNTFFDYCFLAPEFCRQNKTLTSITGAGPAYQVDAGLMGEMLRKMACAAGVERIIDTITEVRLGEDGAIAALARKDGPDLEADLFIDCTGFRSLLLGDALDEPFESYADHLFNDRAVALRYPFEDKEAELTAFTGSTAVSSGWIWQIPLYSRRGSGYVYCSEFQDADDAERELRTFLGEERLRDVQARHLKFKVGKSRRFWVKNCIGIGLSSGFVEPLESTALFTVQLQVETLAHIIAGRHDYNTSDVKVYNRVMDSLYEGIRDFLVAHYAITRREDTPYWRAVKYDTVIPDSLGELLRFARLTQTDLPVIRQIYRPNFGDFSFTDGWLSILLGMNYMPIDTGQFQNVGPFEPAVVHNMSKADQHHASQRRYVAEELPRLPSHYRLLRDTLYQGRD